MSKFLFLMGTFTMVINPIRPVFGLAISDLFYICALGFLVFEGLYSKEPLSKLMPWHPFWTPSLFILFGGLVSTFISENPEICIGETFKAWFMFSFWVSLCISMVRDKHIIRSTLIVFLAGTILISLIAVLDFLTGSELGVAFGGVPTTPDNRYSSALSHPNSLGHFTGIATPILVDIGLITFYNVSNCLNKFLIGISSISIFIILAWANILAGSNAGMFGLLFGVVLVLVVRAWKNDHSARALLFFSSISMLFVITGSSFFMRSETSILNLISNNFSRATEVTGPIRYEYASEAFYLISESPILGYGMDQGGTGSQVSSLTVSVSSVHNSILRAWIGGGVLVFLVVLILYFKATSISIGMIMKYLRGENITYSVGLAAAVFGSVFNDMTAPSFLQRFSWFPVIILLGLMVNKASVYKTERTSIMNYS